MSPAEGAEVLHGAVAIQKGMLGRIACGVGPPHYLARLVHASSPATGRPAESAEVDDRDLGRRHRACTPQHKHQGAYQQQRSESSTLHHVRSFGNG
jgi:hypothetical protein